MHTKSPGYDLRASKLDKVLRVEVKAHSGAAKKVILTVAEWREFNRQTPSDRWELWNVEFVAGSVGDVVITRYSRIPSHALESSGYFVDLTQCSWEA